MRARGLTGPGGSANCTNDADKEGYAASGSQRIIPQRFWIPRILDYAKERFCATRPGRFPLLEDLNRFLRPHCELAMHRGVVVQGDNSFWASVCRAAGNAATAGGG